MDSDSLVGSCVKIEEPPIETSDRLFLIHELVLQSDKEPPLLKGTYIVLDGGCRSNHLRVISIDPMSSLPPSRHRSLFTLSTGMLAFAAKAYNIPEIIDACRASIRDSIMDPYLKLLEDLRLIVNSNLDTKEFGSVSDDCAALASLSALTLLENGSNQGIIENLIKSLSTIFDQEESSIAIELSETFLPDDEFAFGPQLLLESVH